ncbi:hypothetical protein ACVBGC_01805 [Burkholderia stagnalis]
MSIVPESASPPEASRRPAFGPLGMRAPLAHRCPTASTVRSGMRRVDTRDDDPSGPLAP